MRIPLDYYRILGLPIQATAEQLQQAHRDRSLQLPRREYSEVAITARKQLIDEAYAVLSDPDQRQAYDAGFLAKTYELEAETLAGSTLNRNMNSSELISTGVTPFSVGTATDTHTPSIEIDDKQFVGALLILQELGEYELVLKLSAPFLSNGRFKLKLGQLGEPQLVGPDIILTVALACLELGREQWQQGQYENAAASLETGQDLLLKEGLFPHVRGEMQADIYKLRPYRILELLNSSDEKVAERRKGLQLLQDMLQERGGIDGTGNDQSGLSVDDFLRFIQQLREYLTVEEQQNLFEQEARRPSAVATYLAVYALIARGFAQREPILVRQAKLMLQRLGKRQDVHLEQAICSMLLGQTEEASQALELSQEYDTLTFIRKQSREAPDLLPGLCLYGERWLQEEVFPHFRDLADLQVSLKDYFADERVQTYLESLPIKEEEAASEWFPVQTKVTPAPKQTEIKPARQPESIIPLASRFGTATLSTSSSRSGVSSLPPVSSSSGNAELAPPRASRDPKPTPLLSTPMNPPAAASGQSVPELPPTARRSEPAAERRNSRIRASGSSNLGRPTPETDRRQARRSGGGSWTRPNLPAHLKPDRLALLALAGVVGLGAVWFLGRAAFGWLGVE